MRVLVTGAAGVRSAQLPDGHFRIVLRALALWLPLVLFAAFAIATVPTLLAPDMFGWDGRLYGDATRVWLSGGNPWTDVGTPVWRFVGSPLTLLAFLPAVPFGDRFGIVSVIVSVVAGIFIVRRLALPRWWLAYPPLVVSILSGNPTGAMVALVLARHPLANALAVAVKSFAGVPLLGERRWGALVVAAAIAVGSIVVLPELWRAYLTQLPVIAAGLAQNTHYSGTIYAMPPLAVLTAIALVALAVVDPRAAGWLAIPALWPASEYHYGILFLPVSPVLALVGIVNSAPLWSAAVVVYSALRVRRHIIAGGLRLRPTAPSQVMTT